MVPMEKIFVKGKCTIFDLKMVYPHLSRSTVPMLILLHQRAKRCKKIILIGLITVAWLKRVILKYCSKKRTKMYMKNMLLVFLGKISWSGQLTILDIIWAQN